MQVGATVDNPGSEFANAVRVHNALTAKIEKRFLTWMAVRMPEAINPDHLTALAFASQILAGGAYALSSRDGRLALTAGEDGAVKLWRIVERDAEERPAK